MKLDIGSLAIRGAEVRRLSEIDDANHVGEPRENCDDIVVPRLHETAAACNARE
jgi:hypothetical protein